MPQSTRLATLLLILALAVLHNVESDASVIVRPTNSDPSVCGYHAACDTLPNLLMNASAIFTRSLRLTFLNGTHVIDATVTQMGVKVEKIKNMALYGRDAVVVCKTAFPFVFVNVEILEIIGVTFSRCGGQVLGNVSKDSVLFNRHAALFLQNISVFHMEGVSIEHSKGYGLLIYNLLDNGHILNSTLLNNNKGCINLKWDNDLCVGGNIALYFFNRTYASVRPVNVSITNSTIEGGSDLSGSGNVTCDIRLKKPSSRSAFRANGLVVILAQSNYQVIIHVFKVKFYQNTQNLWHPSVLLHDYSKVINSIEIYDSIFSHDGALLLSLVKNNKTTKGNTSLNILTIGNCLFTNGLQTHGIHICVESTKVSHNNFQTVAIEDSMFYNYFYYSAPAFFMYDRALRKANIEISYSFIHSNNFPSTLIEIERCIFSRSTVPSLRFHLKHDSFLDHFQPVNKHPRILTVESSRFEIAKGVYSPLEIVGPEDSKIQWKYRKVSRRDDSFIEFFNCSFSTSIWISDAHILLRNCHFWNSEFTPVHAINSVIAVDGQNVFERNRGNIGGALRLENSTLFLKPNSKTLLLKNYANYGGGIYASQLYTTNLLGIQLPANDPDFYKINFNEDDIGIYDYCAIASSINSQITLTENQALIAGKSIFGGNYINCRYNCTQVRRCNVIPDPASLDLQTIPNYIIINPHSNNTDYTQVSSPANRICLCEKDKPTNKCSSLQVTAFPGQIFNISLIALGKTNGSVPVTMTAVSSSKLNIDNRLHFLSTSCTAFSFSVHSISQSTSFQTISLNISKETSTQSKSKYPQTFNIKIQISPCPLGMTFSAYGYRCKCHNFFEKFEIRCDNKKGEIQIKNNQWIGFLNNSKIVVTNNYLLDYLTTGDKSINLSTPDEQCNFNRSGILCGVCQANLSMVLGTSNCRKCSNVYLFLILPFALAGVALVVLLLKCNLTVSVGHINGIIFYANIVQINKVMLFPDQNAAYRVFSTFIAWLNLDLGMEVCFFGSMDAYAKVWLQFVFPVYLWIMVLLIILFAHYSSRMGRLIGSNSVPVLATLFLLSYAKLLRTIIATISFTFMEFEDGSNVAVWMQDGNIKYASPKHTALFLMGLAFICGYIFPLTLLVLLAPCLQAMSHYKAFSWVNRLKPFLDAYQGPYSKKFRYWTGLFLGLRILLYIINASNYENDPSVSFFWTVVILGPFAIFCLTSRNVYRHKLANYIESFSLLNIVILCLVSWVTTTTGYIKWHALRGYTTYTSVTVMMLVFLLIIFYQIWGKVTSKFRRKKKKNHHLEVKEDSDIRPIKNTPTHTVVRLTDLKDPLLDTQ